MLTTSFQKEAAHHQTLKMFCSTMLMSQQKLTQTILFSWGKNGLQAAVSPIHGELPNMCQSICATHTLCLVPSNIQGLEDVQPTLWNKPLGLRPDWHIPCPIHPRPTDRLQLYTPGLVPPQCQSHPPSPILHLQILITHHHSWPCLPLWSSADHPHPCSMEILSRSLVRLPNIWSTYA